MMPEQPAAIVAYGPQRYRGLRRWLREWLCVPNDGPLLEYSICKLTLKAGDILVLKTDRPVRPEHARALKEQLTPLVPSGVKTVVLERGVDFEIVAAPPPSRDD